jgi:hypothetical protein
MQHLKDYVWMRLGDGPVIQVPATTEALTEKLAAGYIQVDQPAESAGEEQH